MVSDTTLRKVVRADLLAALTRADLRSAFTCPLVRRTLLLTPFLVAWSPAIAGFLARSVEGKVSADPRDSKSDDHVVLIGFGLTGQNLARVLKAREIPYVAVDGNAVAVR